MLCLLSVLVAAMITLTLEECVYVTKAGDTWDAVLVAMGCGTSTASLSPRWYAERHTFNRALANKALSPGQFITIPESCYTNAQGIMTRPVGCQTTNDCTNGNADFVCDATRARSSLCVETSGAFECSCAGGAKPSGGERCSRRYDSLPEKPRPLHCVPTSCATTTVDRCSSATTHSCRGPTSKCTPDPSSALGYACSCTSADYELRDLECVDVNECAQVPSPCAGPGATCTNLSPGYRCVCSGGFEASTDGRSCIASSAVCDAAPCIGGTCVVDAARTLGFRCECAAGLELDGNTCVVSSMNGGDVCTTVTCSGMTAKCQINPNLQQKEFCTCGAGFTVDATNKFLCVDDDECANSFYGRCGSARCVNTVGSFDCVCDDPLESAINNRCVSVCPNGCAPGTCTADGCQCPPDHLADGFAGCRPDCAALGQCHGNGKCVAPNVCECFAGAGSLDPLSCADSTASEFCHTIIYDLLDNEALPPLDGQQEVTITVCNVAVTLVANGGVLAFERGLTGSLGVRHVRKRQSTPKIVRGQSITVKMVKPAVLVDVEMGFGFREGEDFAEIQVDSREPYVVSKNLWTAPEADAIKQFSVGVLSGDGFGLESFTIRNPGLKQNTEPPDFIDLAESIDTFFWLWILLAVLGVVVCVTCVAVWRRKQLAAAVAHVRNMQREIDSSHTASPIYGQDDQYQWSDRHGGSITKADGTVKALANSGTTLQHQRTASFI